MDIQKKTRRKILEESFCFQLLVCFQHLHFQKKQKNNRTKGEHVDFNNPNLSTRQKIYLAITEPSYSRFASWWDRVILLTLLVSVVVYIIETLPQYWDEDLAEFAIIDWTCILIFTFDYLIRLATAPKTWKFISTPLNIIDFLSFFPFFVENFLLRFGVDAPMLSAGRMLRLLRVFRLFKLTRYSTNLQVIVLTFQRSGDGFIMLFVILSITLIISSAAIFYAEQTVEVFDTETKTWMRLDQTERFEITKKNIFLHILEGFF